MSNEQTRAASALADAIIFRAMQAILERGVGFEIMIDRMLTAASAHIAHHDGAEAAAKVFRTMADNIDAGALVSVERRTIAN